MPPPNNTCRCTDPFPPTTPPHIPKRRGPRPPRRPSHHPVYCLHRVAQPPLPPTIPPTHRHVPPKTPLPASASSIAQPPHPKNTARRPARPRTPQMPRPASASSDAQPPTPSRPPPPNTTRRPKLRGPRAHRPTHSRPSSNFPALRTPRPRTPQTPRSTTASSVPWPSTNAVARDRVVRRTAHSPHRLPPTTPPVAPPRPLQTPLPATPTQAKRSAPSEERAAVIRHLRFEQQARSANQRVSGPTPTQAKRSEPSAAAPPQYSPSEIGGWKWDDWICPWFCWIFVYASGTLSSLLNQSQLKMELVHVYEACYASKFLLYQLANT